jgi:hypothetical protein
MGRAWPKDGAMIPRFLPSWLGGEADHVDGCGVRLRLRDDALPHRPDQIADPLPEDLERLLRNPEIAIPQDRSLHDLLRAYLLRNPEATVTREAYLNLYALLLRDEP